MCALGQLARHLEVVDHAWYRWHAEIQLDASVNVVGKLKDADGNITKSKDTFE